MTAKNKTLQKFNTWNTLVKIYGEFLEREKNLNDSVFFISYYTDKIRDAKRFRDEAFNKLSKTVQKTLQLN